MIDDELKIWAAGLFDGEGHASIQDTRGSYEVVVAVSTTSRSIAVPIQEAWGGHYPTGKQSYRRCRDGSMRKPDYSVYFSRDEAKKFLADIFPYLRAKQGVVRIVLQALCAVPGEDVLRSKNRLRAPRGLGRALKPYYQQLRSLNE